MAAAKKAAKAAAAKVAVPPIAKPVAAVAVAAAAATAAPISAQAKLAVARSFRLEQVLSATSINDVVLSKQEGPALFSFLAFPGADAKAVTARIANIPQAERHVHSVFGRNGAKLDLAMDLDFPHCTAPAGDAAHYTRDSVVLDALNAVSDYYVKKLQVAAPTDIVVLDGHSLKKHSVHIHVRSAEGIFPDFKAVKEILGDINALLKVPAIDLGVMRPNGSMRVAFTPKYNEPNRILLPLQASDSELTSRLKFMHRDLSEADILERSLIVNPQAQCKAFRGTSSSARTLGYDDFGHAITPFMEESKKWLRYRECVNAIKRYPVSVSEEYDTWIRVGLALHSFGSDDHIKDQWKTVSARCRHKYNPAVCDKLWVKFAARPNCFNWRRGYNYLVGSLSKRYKTTRSD